MKRLMFNTKRLMILLLIVSACWLPSFCYETGASTHSKPATMGAMRHSLSLDERIAYQRAAADLLFTFSSGASVRNHHLSLTADSPLRIMMRAIHTY
ncbi:MAG TPA: hypothetical protein VNN73_17905 [Blastocatellia bacterium]|nr:hypothetical protein [Blastocatellia bacterium]